MYDLDGDDKISRDEYLKSTASDYSFSFLDITVSDNPISILDLWFLITPLVS